jgi:hypothetical protein
MITKKKIAAIIATTAAVAFVTAPLTATVASAHHGKVKCHGVNSCKGKHNSCKGKGYKMMSAKACKKAGGNTDAPAASTEKAPAPAAAEPAADNNGAAN